MFSTIIVTSFRSFIYFLLLSDVFFILFPIWWSFFPAPPWFSTWDHCPACPPVVWLWSSMTWGSVFKLAAFHVHDLLVFPCDLYEQQIEILNHGFQLVTQANRKWKAHMKSLNERIFLILYFDYLNDYSATYFLNRYGSILECFIGRWRIIFFLFVCISCIDMAYVLFWVIEKFPLFVLYP